MHVRRALALASAVAAAAFAACKDVPFAPKWDADMFMPLSTKQIHLDSVFTLGVIPPATSGNVSFKPLTQDVAGPIGALLQKLDTATANARTELTLTIRKRTAVSAIDTLFIAPDSASLTSPITGRIVFPVALAVADTLVTDSMAASLASIQMLYNAAANTRMPLWIQLRGKVTNPSASPVTITKADSLTIRLTVTARVAVSQ
jgi:hypothetical protein